MAKKMESFMVPGEFYLVETERGYEFYDKDPLTFADRESNRVDLGKVLVDFLGHCDRGNPIKLRLRAAVLDRTRPFEASAPDRIRRGALAAHLCDLEGNHVEMLPGKTQDTEFPFHGAVISPEGEPLGFRKYSILGRSEDGVDEHRVVLMDGIIGIPEPRAEEEAPAAPEPDEMSGVEPLDDFESDPEPEQEKPKRKRAFLGKKKQSDDGASANLFPDEPDLGK